MANTIQLKRSSVASKVPTTTDLALGEIAINTYDGNLFIKKNNGSDAIVKIANANLGNVAPSSTGILVSTGSGLAYRSIAGDGGAISVTLADGVSGNPTVQFSPSAVSLSQFAGGINSILPTQTGNSGKFLTTNGATSSWASVSASPAGSTGQLQYNNGGVFGGVSKTLVTSQGDLELVQSATPVVASSTSNIVVYKSNSAYPTLAIKHPSLGIAGAADDLLQAQFGSKDIGWWNPPGNATTVPGVLGLTAPTANGTATARTTATGNAVQRTRRLGYVTAATLNAVAGQSWTARQWTYGDGAGLGGFYMIYRFAVSDASLVSTGRWSFVGMTNQSGVLSALPTTACFGMIQQVGGTNWFMRCAGGSMATDVGLGANFPIDLTSVYEVRLFASPTNSTQVQYEVIRLNTGDTAVGAFSTAGLSLSSTTLMAPQCVRSVGATQATAVGIDIMSLYIEKTF